MGNRGLNAAFWHALEIRLRDAKFGDPDRLAKLLSDLELAHVSLIDYGRVEAIVAALVQPPRSTGQPTSADVADGRPASRGYTDSSGHQVHSTTCGRVSGQCDCGAQEPVKRWAPPIERPLDIHKPGCAVFISNLNACTCPDITASSRGTLTYDADGC